MVIHQASGINYGETSHATPASRSEYAATPIGQNSCLSSPARRPPELSSLTESNFPFIFTLFRLVSKLVNMEASPSASANQAIPSPISSLGTDQAHSDAVHSSSYECSVCSSRYERLDHLRRHELSRKCCFVIGLEAWLNMMTQTRIPAIMLVRTARCVSIAGDSVAFYHSMPVNVC